MSGHVVRGHVLFCTVMLSTALYGIAMSGPVRCSGVVFGMD